jgi:outer membrane biosynthesis protein TonB
MKKSFLILLTVLIAVGAAVVYWYAPAREKVQGWCDALRVYAATPVAEQPVVETPAPAVVTEPEPVPAPEPQQVKESPDSPAPVEPAPEPGSEPAPAAEPAPTPSSAPEPEPQPEPETLPALNAESEQLKPKAEAGDAVAQFNLARQYALGEGMAVNREEFIRWCRTSAEQGLPEARFTLGMCYHRGLGVAPDKAEAQRLLRLAADAGFAPAAEALKCLSF